LTASVAPVFAQSLADVARKEEERRKAVSQSGEAYTNEVLTKKVYTNKDLRPVPSTLPPAAAEPKTGQKPASDQDATSPDMKAAADSANPRAKDRAYWSDRLKAVQEQLERDQTYAAALQSRINALTADFVNRDDPAQKGVIERDRLRAIAELDRLRQ